MSCEGICLKTPGDVWRIIRPYIILWLVIGLMIGMMLEWVVK